jgi:hypothetical protein
MVPNSHLLGMFRRVCKLLFNRIRPVFVFDGPAPALKRKTLAERQRLRNESKSSLHRTAERILLNQLKIKGIDLVRNSLAPGNATALKTATKRKRKAESAAAAAVKGESKGDDGHGNGDNDAKAMHVDSDGDGDGDAAADADADADDDDREEDVRLIDWKSPASATAAAGSAAKRAKREPSTGSASASSAAAGNPSAPTMAELRERWGGPSAWSEDADGDDEEDESSAAAGGGGGGGGRSRRSGGGGGGGGGGFAEDPDDDDDDGLTGALSEGVRRGGGRRGGGRGSGVAGAGSRIWKRKWRRAGLQATNDTHFNRLMAAVARGETLDPVLVAALPMSQQIEIMAEGRVARRVASMHVYNETARSRPDAFSDAQLNNFLLSTKFNRNVNAVPQRRRHTAYCVWSADCPSPDARACVRACVCCCTDSRGVCCIVPIGQFRCRQRQWQWWRCGRFLSVKAFDGGVQADRLRAGASLHSRQKDCRRHTHCRRCRRCCCRCRCSYWSIA